MENKYLKKYIKYTDKIKDLDILQGGNRFNCKQDEKFANICKPDDSGKYKSKDSCINDCEGKYIENQTTRSGIIHETRIFYKFIKEIIDKEKMNITIRGGNVLGLEMLKMIYKKYPDDKFEHYFNEFLKLELVKDWDFAGKPQDKEIDVAYRNKLDKMAKKFRLVNRAKTFILYQTRKPILTDDKALFEIAIRQGDTYSTLELPLTTMEMNITQYNLKYIFMFASSFFAYKTKKEQFDLDIIKRMIPKLHIYIYPHKNGLFDIKKSEFNAGNLSAALIKFINTFDDIDKNLPQFLAMQIEEPHRIFYRLIQKNIPKAEKLIKFIKNNNLAKEIPEWIFDPKQIMDIMVNFLESFSNKIRQIYMEKGQFLKKTDDIQPAINDIINFTMGINFSRIQLTYEDINEDGIKLIKKMFSFVDILDKDSFMKLNDNSKFVQCIKFLYQKEVLS